MPSRSMAHKPGHFVFQKEAAIQVKINSVPLRVFIVHGLFMWQDCDFLSLKRGTGFCHQLRNLGDGD